MNTTIAEIIVWTYGIAAGIYLLFGAYLASGWRGGRHGGQLLVAIILSFLWVTAYFAFGITRLSLWVQIALLLNYLQTLVWLLFLHGLLDVVVESGVAKRRFPTLKIISVGLVGVAVISLFIRGQLSARFALLPLLVLSIWALALVEQLYRNFPAGSRWGIKPLCLGLAGAYAFDLYLYADAFLFAQIDAEIAAARGLVHALAMPLIAISAVRSRAWTFRISVSRQVVFHSTALAMSGLYLLLVAAAGYYVRWFGGNWGRALQVTLLFIGAVLLCAVVFSGSFRARLRVLLDKHFFAQRYDYRQEWLKFTQALASPALGHSLPQSVIRAVADLVESPGGALWMQEADGYYRPRAELNQPPMNADEAADSEFCGFLQEREWILNLEEYRAFPSHYDDLLLPQWLASQADAWLVVPLISVGQLIGFVVLSAARAPVEVNWEVRDLLKTTGRQAASYLVQIQATEALLESQKFDSFNRMSAFVVHDLKNLVAQMSLMLKNADRHKNNPEFQEDMLMTTEHVTERMKQLMVQLQEKKSINLKKAVDLNEMAEHLAQQKKHHQPLLSLNNNATGLRVLAHAEKLERVIGHVVQNALDATPEHGKVELDIAQRDARALITVRDNGCGMSAEFIKEKLFKPFQSTKINGMGIGCYETFQYIQELGGSLEVESKVGVGTEIKIFLPLIPNTAEIEVG